MNPLAPVAINGVNDVSPRGYKEQSFDYVYDVTLTANQALYGQVVSIITSADFALRALVISSFTGTFSTRFTDGQGFYLSNALINNTNLLGTPADPWIFFPEVLYPAGGRILVDIQDTSGSGNTIELVFRGASRYRI